MKQLFPTVDVNGKHTHVWRNTDTPSSDASSVRLAATDGAPPVPNSRGAAGTSDSLMDDIESWTPIYPDLDTVEGAFDKCKRVSDDVTRHLVDLGYEAERVVAQEGKKYYPERAARWQKFDSADFVHYITRVTGDDGKAYYVDYTARQFEPDADFPLVMAAAEYEKRWYVLTALDDQHRATRTIKREN